MNNKVKFLRGTSGEYAVAEKDSDTIYFTTDDGKLYIGDKEISASTGGGSYELPIATTEILGGVMPDGTTITVNENGVITAISAEKLNTSAGSSTKPVYFSGGKPVACTYTLSKSVPSNAVFTDTVYTLPKATTSVLGGVKVDGTTITVNSNGVISSAGGLTVDTLLDITITRGDISGGDFSSCSPAQNSVITLAGNIDDYKFIYVTHTYNGTYNITDAATNGSPRMFDTSVFTWGSISDNSIAILFYLTKVRLISTNEVQIVYLKHSQNSNNLTERLLIVGIK